MGEIKPSFNETNNSLESKLQKLKSDINTTVSDAKNFVESLFESKNYTDNSEYKSKDEPLIRTYEDGTKKYFDDNGKEYRVNNDLVPNNKYEINGYQYTTDEKGRIIEASGKLHIKERKDRLPIRDDLNTTSKGEAKKTDSNGHVVGDQFSGTNGLENIVSQDKTENCKDYRNLENKLAKHTKNGDNVKIDIKITYPKDSHRPNGIAYGYNINGEKNIRFFPNGGLR